MEVPSAHDVDDFLENVSEVSRLIEGLKAGTISPDYVDTKLEAKSERAKKVADAKQQQKNPQLQIKPNENDAKDVSDDAQTREAARQAELQRKVEELTENRARKLRARQKYEEYTHGKNSSQNDATDYGKWDLWCPSDEEDDLFNSLTPNTPAFKAMEKDINDRHRRMVEQRQLAERQRQAGNAAFKSKQYSEALRCYQLGLEAQRHNMALHANAAAAALKMHCYVQALEHCDKVLHLARVLHNTPHHPLCVKALQRRAAAHQALGQHSKAVQDLMQAAAILPGDKEVIEQLQLAKLLVEEHKVAKQLQAAAAAHGTDKQEQAAATAIITAAAGGDGDGVASSDMGSAAAAANVAAAAGTARATNRQRQEPAAAAGAANDTAPTAAAVNQDSQPPLSFLQRIKQLVAVVSAHDNTANNKADDASGTSSEKSIRDACEELTRLVAADTRSCIYFWECGGITAAAKQVTKAQNPAAALQLLAAACLDSSTNLRLVVQQPQLLAAVLDAATSSSSSSGSGDADGSCNAVAAAAAGIELLYYVSTEAPLRQQLCQVLLQKSPAVRHNSNSSSSTASSGSSSALQRLWGACLAMQFAPPGQQQQEKRSIAVNTQVCALSLLSNCMFVSSVKQAAHQLLQQQQGLNQLQQLADLLRLLTQTAAHNSSSAAAALRTEKLLGLLSNISTHVGVRQQLAEHKELLTQILAAAALKGDTTAAAGSSSSSSSSVTSVSLAAGSVQAAAMGCLCNLSLEPDVQKETAAKEVVKALLAMTTAAVAVPVAALGSSGSSSSMEGAQPAACGPKLPARKQQRSKSFSPAAAAAPDVQLQQLVISQRAAVLLSRAAKQADAVQQLQQLQALGKILGAVTIVLNTQQQQHGQVDEQDGDQDAAALLASWLDAAMRIVALLTAQPGACSSCSNGGGISNSSRDVGCTAITACLALLQAVNAKTTQNGSSSSVTRTSTAAPAAAAVGVSAGVQGNAALVLSHYAAEPCWHAKLRKSDAVGVLVRVAAVHGKGSAVTRNAGIALARMASDSAMMERLRDVHGIEVIYQYVKP